LPGYTFHFLNILKLSYYNTILYIFNNASINASMMQRFYDLNFFLNKLDLF